MGSCRISHDRSVVLVPVYLCIPIKRSAHPKPDSKGVRVRNQKEVWLHLVNTPSLPPTHGATITNQLCPRSGSSARS